MANKYKLYQGDCLEVMDRLIEQGIKVDAIISDPPYGTTACKWDSVIPFEKMWDRLNKLIKPNGAVVLFGSEPFSSTLRCSNIKDYKYDWIWHKKRFNSGFAHAKNKPLKKHENISVFSKGVTIHKGQSEKRMEYNPQGLTPINKKRNNTSNTNTSFGKRPSHRRTVQEFTNYPISIIDFDFVKKDFNNKKLYHETQKPVDLLEYLIKTYTNENELVLDFTMGSGSTGVACINTNRNFIGIELDENYFNIAKQRIEEAKNNQISFKLGETYE